MDQADNDILTTGEAAGVCGVSRSTLRRAVAQGQLTAWHTPGKHLRFSRASCIDFARKLGRSDLVDVVGRAHADNSARAGERIEALHR